MTPARRASLERVHVAIVGTGFAGLAMAIQLERAGFHDLVLLEKSHDVGGTWRDNVYPGCACDVPAHLYSFSFAPNPDWSRAYAPQAEIRAYIERCVERFQLRPHVRFGAQVVSAILDEHDATWTVRTADGRVVVADVLIAATGGLSRPLIPALPGLDRFRGHRWHSATWNHAVPLAGKTVAVVGTGASALQFVPRIAPEVRRLHLFQRTPPWVLPRPDRVFTDDEKRRFRNPAWRWLYRQYLYWRHEGRAIPFTLEPRILRYAQGIAERHIARHIADPELRRKVTPDYLMGCKRILMSNDYYPALARPNVEVVTEGIREVTSDAVITADGQRRPVDAILFGTGFDVHDHLGPVEIRGAGGRELSAQWRRCAEAYLGLTVSGFPNLFTLIGPNTGLGHTSILVMIEAQVRHVIGCLRAMRDGDIALVEPRPEVMQRYNAELQRRLARTVWQSGCKSWYQNADGRNTTLWPGSAAEFALRTWRFDRSDYRMVRHADLPRPAVSPAPEALAT